MSFSTIEGNGRNDGDTGSYIVIKDSNGDDDTNWAAGGSLSGATYCPLGGFQWAGYVRVGEDATPTLRRVMC